VVAADDLQRMHSYLYALMQHFAVKGVTSILTFEATAAMTELDAKMSAVSDNIINLAIHPGEQPRRTIHPGEQPRRTLRIVKARGVGHDLATRDFFVEAAGGRVGPAAA
jgi:circadian clock protein KaiC